MSNLETNYFLVFGALLSAIASALHLAIIAGGPAWYRYFGAGEKFASAAQDGKLWPHLVTFGIALTLALWAAYALSGAGVIGRLPYLLPALIVITSIYALRGAALFPMLLFAKARVTPFDVWSSLVCLGFGVVHIVGLWQVWRQL